MSKSVSIDLPAKVEAKIEEVKVEVAAKSMAGLRSLVAGGVGGVFAVISGMFVRVDATSRDACGADLDV
jgi:hypothetical protein